MYISRQARLNLLVFLAAIFAAGLFCLTQQNAAALTDSAIASIGVNLTYEGQTFSFRYPDIQYADGIDHEAEKCFEKDFRGRITRQKRKIFCSYTLKDARQKLADIAEKIYLEPINAEVTFAPDSKVKFDIAKDTPGKCLNIEKTLAQIDKYLSRGRSANIALTVDSITPQITEYSLRKATAVRKEFSTDFSRSSPDRKHNVKLALSQFNGMVLRPGDEVSFNKTVGPRTEERGYKTAKIIMDGQFVDGTGGGVCQTSTTLYNAALLADLKITEYHRHTLAVSYIQPSFDAMVNMSTADLKFVNDSNNYIFIKAWAEKDRAYVRLYGEKLPYRIVRKSTVTKVYDIPREKVIVDNEGKYTGIYEGERILVISSKPKTESTGELEYYDGNRLIKTRMLRKDVYAQLIGTEVIGTRKRDTVPKPPSDLFQDTE